MPEEEQNCSHILYPERTHNGTVCDHYHNRRCIMPSFKVMDLPHNDFQGSYDGHPRDANCGKITFKEQPWNLTNKNTYGKENYPRQRPRYLRRAQATYTKPRMRAVCNRDPTGAQKAWGLQVDRSSACQSEQGNIQKSQK